MLADEDDWEIELCSEGKDSRIFPTLSEKKWLNSFASVTSSSTIEGKLLREVVFYSSDTDLNKVD